MKYLLSKDSFHVKKRTKKLEKVVMYFQKLHAGHIPIWIDDKNLAYKFNSERDALVFGSKAISDRGTVRVIKFKEAK